MNNRNCKILIIKRKNKQGMEVWHDSDWKKVSVLNSEGDGIRYAVTWKKAAEATGYEVKFYESSSDILFVVKKKFIVVKEKKIYI